MEANYVLVKTSLTNGLRSLKENTTTLQRNQAAVWNYTTLVGVELEVEATIRVSGLISKTQNEQTWVQRRTQQDLQQNYTTYAHVSR